MCGMMTTRTLQCCEYAYVRAVMQDGEGGRTVGAAQENGRQGGQRKREGGLSLPRPPCKCIMRRRRMQWAGGRQHNAPCQKIAVWSPSVRSGEMSAAATVQTLPHQRRRRRRTKQIFLPHKAMKYRARPRISAARQMAKSLAHLHLLSRSLDAPISIYRTLWLYRRGGGRAGLRDKARRRRRRPRPRSGKGTRFAGAATTAAAGRADNFVARRRRRPAVRRRDAAAAATEEATNKKTTPNWSHPSRTN
jgi:hypothetical protein